MHRLFKEPNDKCLYKRVTLPYTVAVDRLYSKQEIEHLKLTSPSFKREFECVFGYVHEGSSFTDAQIQRAISIPYDLEPDYDVSCSIGIDPGYTAGTGGGGAFGITIVQQSDNFIKIKYSHTYKNAEHSEMVNEVIRLMEHWDVDKCWVDSSAVSFIRSLKESIGENSEYKQVIEQALKEKMDPNDRMQICPVNFGTQHKQLMFHAKTLMSDGKILIDKEAFPNLVAAIQTAKDRDNAYIKSEGQFTDEFDSWRLAINSEMYTY